VSPKQIRKRIANITVDAYNIAMKENQSSYIYFFLLFWAESRDNNAEQSTAQNLTTSSIICLSLSLSAV
jgi:hypothetical protein